jgi:two-component system response regulator NreC
VEGKFPLPPRGYSTLPGLVAKVVELTCNKDIASSLSLSNYAVETHRGNILQKLNLHSVPELILYAVRKGVIS